MENTPIIGDFIVSLNWITITTPFIVSYLAFRWGTAFGEGKGLPAIVAAVCFFGLFAIWAVLYHFIGFPLWMRNFR